MSDSGELGAYWRIRTRTKLLLLFKEYIDADAPIAGPSGLRRGSAGSDQGSESEPESSSDSDEGSEYNESEGEQERAQLQPAENEIEGDFECVCSLYRSIGSQRAFVFC